MARLTLTLLGGFRARLEPGAPLPLPTRKAQALLAYLAMPPGLVHSRDKLATLLWGSTVETTARTSLRQTLYALRKSLRGADPPPLRVAAGTVALDPACLIADVSGFEQRVADATPTALIEAVSLYKGDLLEGLAVQEPPFEDWLLRERERLRELALGAFERVLADQRAAHATEAAIQTALRLLALDPLQEPVHRMLMQLYVESGRRGAALRQYQLCVATLQRELRTEPEGETKALYQEILRRRVRGKPDAVGPSAQSIAAAPSPPRPTTAEVPGVGDLPLVGRERDLTRFEAWLTDAWPAAGASLS